MSLPLISETSLFLLVAGFAILIGVGADVIAQRLRVPDILWLILFGVIAGPVFGWVTRSAVLTVAPVVGTAVLIIILFDAGLDLRSDFLRPLLASAVTFAVVTYIASVLVLLVVADEFLFPQDPLLSLFFASALGATSGAIAIPVANRLGFVPALRGFVHLDAALEDAVAIVFTSVLVLFVAPAGGVSTVDLVLVLTLPIPVGIAVGVLGGVAWLLTLSRWQSRPYAALATLGFVLAVYGISQLLQGSGILAALIVGITIANAPTVHRLLRWVRPVRVSASIRAVQTDLAFLLRALFLFFLGALVELTNPGLVPVVVVGTLSVGLLLLRWLVARSLAGRHRIEFAWSSAIGGVGGRGLTSAVLLLLPLGVVAGANALFLPGVLLIVGTDIVMTLWLLLAPPSPEEPTPPPLANIALSEPILTQLAHEDERPPLPNPVPPK